MICYYYFYYLLFIITLNKIHSLNQKISSYQIITEKLCFPKKQTSGMV